MSLLNKPCSGSEGEANQGNGLLDKLLRREHGVEVDRRQSQEMTQAAAARRATRALCADRLLAAVQELSPLEQRLRTVEPFMTLFLELRLNC